MNGKSTMIVAGYECTSSLTSPLWRQPREDKRKILIHCQEGIPSTKLTPLGTLSERPRERESSNSSSSSSRSSSNSRSSKQKPNSLGDFLVFWNSNFHIVFNTAELSTIHHVVFGILFFTLYKFKV